MSDAKMPQRYDIEADGYMLDCNQDDSGHWVMAEAVESLVAEVNRLRAQLAQARKHADYMLDCCCIGAVDHYTSMCEVSVDVLILQDILKA